MEKKARFARLHGVKSIAAALLLVMSSPVAAVALSGQVHLASHHFAGEWEGSRANFREENLGAGIVARRGDLALSAGAYQNSIYQTTAYVGAARVFRYPSGVEFRAGLMVATGYEQLDHVGLVAVAPVLQIRYRAATATILPGAVSFSLEFNITN